MAELQERASHIRENQATALSATGEASSHDGTVRATVDATGVLTALNFTPSLFDRTTPDKLARTIVATTQAAASKARAQADQAWQSIRSDNSGLLATAAKETGRWGVLAGGVPEVPNTATDPTGDEDSWQRKETPVTRAANNASADEFPPDGRAW
jgi:DNA-binding protein YbaB